MRLPPARTGVSVLVRGRRLDFTLWPVTRAKAGATLNSRLFVADPWPVMSQVAHRLPTSEQRNAARAFLEQAQDFYRAAGTASTTAAKPLLLYYAFLNVAKALILVRLPATNLDAARHGLSERVRPGGKELTGAFLETQRAGGTPLVFDLLHRALTKTGITAGRSFDVPALMRQVVPGHRLFLAATSNATESFLAPRSIELLHDPATHSIWMRVAIDAGDRSRLGVGHLKLLQLSRLAPGWRSVRVLTGIDEVWLEAVMAAKYNQGWISDAVMPLIDSIRHHLWQTVLTVPPYRAYYLFLPPAAELPSVLPQICSAYALIYYFGSTTRYRPHHFDRILAGPYGAFVESFMQDQPSQLLFLFASEFAQREVSKAALV